MYVHLFSRGEDFFKEKITIDEACQLLELQETTEIAEDNFIGFTHPSDDEALIQFIRIQQDEWLFDIPLYVNGDYIGSYVSEINHSLALTITTEFFHHTPLQKAIVGADHDDIRNVCRQRWSLEFNFVKPNPDEM